MQTSPSAAPVSYSQAYAVRDIPLKHPAYAYVGPDAEGHANQDLWVTSFGPFGKDSITRMPLTAALDPQGSQVPEVVTDKITWPNELTFEGNKVLVGSGFLVPGKSSGAVTELPLSGKSDPNTLVEKKSGWFYHRVCPLPNGDLITARATRPILFGSPQGELVALHPQGGDTDRGGTYREEVLAQGPDMNITVADLHGDGQTEILAPEFFGKKLSLFTHEGDAWKETVIDPDLGPGFDCSVVRLNGPDGPPVLLATNNQSNGTGGVFAYEIPQDLTHGSWVKHTLLADIPNAKSGPGTGAPGNVQTFFPGPHAPDARPSLLLSTDDGEHLMWGIPGEKPYDYTFHQTESLEATVGQPAVTPTTDADGYPFVFVPIYDKNVVRVYSFNPKYEHPSA